MSKFQKWILAVTVIFGVSLIVAQFVYALTDGIKNSTNDVGRYERDCYSIARSTGYSDVMYISGYLDSYHCIVINKSGKMEEISIYDSK